MREGCHTYEMHAAPGVCLRYLLLEDFGALYWAAGRGDAGDEYLGTVGL